MPCRVNVVCVLDYRSAHSVAHCGRTEADGGQQGDRVLHMVGREDAEDVALAEAPLVQAAGQCIDVMAQLLCRRSQTESAGQSRW